jgi:hypothetical protein
LYLDIWCFHVSNLLWKIQWLYSRSQLHVDGAALAPTAFGEFDEDSGIWKPKALLEVLMVHNGSYLNFSDAVI